MEYSDWELVREIKNGNEDAMELLVRRYYPQVFRYVLQIIESEQDSYDVTQDIFLSVIQNISSYLPLKKFGSWLFTIAHNKCMDYFKMNHSDRFVDITEIEIHDTETPFDRQIIDSIVMDEALAKLTPPQREVVILHFIHRFTAKQISRMTKTPLCGALPTVYLSAALLGVAAKVRSPESISIVAIALWLALCFAMLYFPLNELLLRGQCFG